MQQRRQVVGAHVEQGARPRLVQEIRVGMPRLNALLHQVRRRPDYRPDLPALHNAAGRLNQRPQGHIRGTAQVYPLFPGKRLQLRPLRIGDRQRFFTVDMLTGLNRLPVQRIMGLGRAEI